MVNNLSPKKGQEKSRWLSKFTSSTSISNKISCGYALALGICLVGTATGVIIGNTNLEQARKKLASFDAEKSYVAKIQQEVFQTRMQQMQMIILLGKPAKLEDLVEDFIRDKKQLKNLFLEFPKEIEPAEAIKLQKIIAKNEENLNFFLLQAEAFFSELDLGALPLAKIPALRQRLIDFASSKVALQVDEFSEELETIVEEIDEKQEVASHQIASAEVLRTQIIALSGLLSAAIATILAIYTSRAIAKPLKTATNIAKIVAQDNNFDLQILVTTEDEVGVLTTTLNQLIDRVKQLLEAQKTEAMQQLIQNEKMASLGRMVAGVSHEINNAVNCIHGNISPLSQYTKDLLILNGCWETTIPQQPPEVKELAEKLDIEFLKEDLPKILDSMNIAVDRARQILFSLKDFSRLDVKKASKVNLHDCIDSTLLILHNRLKKNVRIVREYGEIVPIEGYTGFLYQVFMNLFTNALDAMEGMTGVKEIVITTERVDRNWIVVRVKDNGSGIAPENLDKIFENFFTTKPRGVGTGLGLAISHQIVVEKHGGKLTVASELGKGTEFTITLPVKLNEVTSPQQNL
ncbi:MAG: ATP-binding protein [Oscillatoriaceae cyanobacterium Prado104]|jgi:signal transduction histidine kinase|nr:ATP-binding protein [Oscillatoriaceae cyanobacterium Prado104]